MHIPAYLAKLLLPILWSCEDNLRNVKEIADSAQALRASVGVNAPDQLPLRISPHPAPPPCPWPRTLFHLSPGPPVPAPVMP